MIEADAATIVRDGSPIDWQGVRAGTLDALVGWLGAGWPPGRWLVADLSLGAWRGHQVAAELLAQLGEPAIPVVDAGPTAAGDGVGCAEVIGAGVDAEARGDAATSTALTAAGRVVHALGSGPRCIVVFAPRHGMPWEDENLKFLWFLIRGVLHSASRLLIVGPTDEPVDVPSGSRVEWHDAGAGGERRRAGLAALVPGILAPETLRALPAAETSLLPLERGHALVPPEARACVPFASRLEFDRLAAHVQSHGWLEAYAQYRGNNLYIDPHALAREAWRRFAEGSPGIALRLMSRARQVAASVTEQATLEAQAQGMRIATHRFGEAAAVADPVDGLPASLRGFLLQTKGWGLVMSNDAEGAEPYMHAARSLVPAGDREWLYLLNIHALVSLKRKDWESAVALERAVEAANASPAGRDWRLHYVNMLNLARLHRRRGLFEDAARHYDAAFGTTRGLGTESDAVYRNVCLAQLEQDRGRPTEALRAWLRASLHWVASAAPEALGHRVITAVLGRAVAWTDVAERMSEALISALIAASHAARISPIPLDDGVTPTCARLDALSAETMRRGETRVVGAPGWSIVAVPDRLPAAVDGVEHGRLRALLRALLGGLCPVAALDHAGTLLVDDRFGTEMAVTGPELLDTVVHAGASVVVFDGRELVVSPEGRRALERDAHVGVSPAVDRIEDTGHDVRVRFKRYRAPYTCAPDESEILRAIGDRPTVGVLTARLDGTPSPPGVPSTVRALEHRRVVHVTLADESDVFARLVSGRVRA
jgi:tetratricopeptide (TPR) repeat protein